MSGANITLYFFDASAIEPIASPERWRPTEGTAEGPSRRGHLFESDLQLIFRYKLAFEATVGSRTTTGR